MKNKTENEYNIGNILDACGFAFRSLSLHSDGRWIAKTGKRHRPSNKLFTGKTAGDALYKMLLAINNEAKTK
jgi:hypothetical protein